MASDAPAARGLYGGARRLAGRSVILSCWFIREIVMKMSWKEVVEIVGMGADEIHDARVVRRVC